jgi:DNA-binding SARP family transcriptional activator
VKRPSTERRSADAADAQVAARLLQQGLALALQDIGAGRAELRDAAARFEALGDARQRLLAAAALVVFIGIADDEYTGFEDAAAFVDAASEADRSPWPDPAPSLLLEAGALVAGWFHALDAPGLAARAARISAALEDLSTPVALRCCAGLTVLGYHQKRMDQGSVLWLELAMRPLLADPALPRRLADEAFHMFVQALYQCEATAQALALRERRRARGPAPLPAIELKLLLLDAQMALGAGDAEAGRVTLERAEPLLDPRAPVQAGWWHLLRSRLELLAGRRREALVHARLALRLGSQSRLPERWMGVTVMQEGQVLMADGEYLAALPFFERAGRAASGAQARFCWCLAHLARALHHLGAAELPRARSELAAGLALARELAWRNFFRASPPVAGAVCAAALEQGIEADFVREVIAERGLQAVRPDLAAWPWPIRVRTLGALRIELEGQALVFRGKVARKPLELLLFVIASGGTDVSVGTVSFALWRELEGDKARAAFNVALHRLRKLLADDEALLLEHGRVSLNAQRVWVDALAFEQLADQVGAPSPELLSAAAHAAADRAQALYSGAFLGDSEDEPWQMVYRARLASKFRRLVTLLAQAAHARGDRAAARALLERGLEFDALAEDLARDLMRELLAAGEAAAALMVFERCRAALALTLHARPSASTLALAELARATPEP